MHQPIETLAPRLVPRAITEIYKAANAEIQRLFNNVLAPESCSINKTPLVISKRGFKRRPWINAALETLKIL